MPEDPAALRPNIFWTPDCQGKQDYDGDLVSVNTRYWPRGGGYFVFDSKTGEFEDDEDRPEIKPHANSSIILNDGSGGDYDGTVLAEKDFEAETEEEVKQMVEEWVRGQAKRIFGLILEKTDA